MTLQTSVNTYGGPSYDFQPWECKNHVKIANSVAKLKKKLTQNQLLVRTKVTEQKSRQDFDQFYEQYLTRVLPSHCN